MGKVMGGAISLNAVRQRRHRERQRRGACVVPVEVTCEMVEALIRHGDLDEKVACNHKEVGKSVEDIAYPIIKKLTAADVVVRLQIDFFSYFGFRLLFFSIFS